MNSKETQNVLIAKRTAEPPWILLAVSSQFIYLLISSHILSITKFGHWIFISGDYDFGVHIAELELSRESACLPVIPT